MDILWGQKPNGHTTQPGTSSSTHNSPNDSNLSPHKGDKKEENDSRPPLYQAEHSSAQADGEEKNALEDTKLRDVWQGIMGFEHTGKPHRNVAVLMISWAEELDDLKTKPEVQQLEGVFRNLFHYEVVPREIKMGKRPCLQLTKHLVEFVDRFDSPTTLLIVYYAGHGFARSPGILQLAGNRQTDTESSVNDSAGWHDLEHIIRDAEGDALLIFDCCQAGSLIFQDGRSFKSSRSFECMGACGPKSTTGLPGESSFTTALIWALTELAEERKAFTTLQLQTKIMSAPNFPKNQFVPVGERNEPCDQRLILSPVSASDQPASPAPTTSTETIDLPQNFIDLRLWYFHRPSSDEIESLATRLRRLQLEKFLHAQRIDGRGLKNVDQDRSEQVVRPYANKWMSLLKPRRKSNYQAALTNNDMTGSSSSSGGFVDHANHSSASDTRSEYHDEQEANDVLQETIHKETISLGAIGKSNYDLEPPLSTGTDFAREEKDNHLQQKSQDELSISKGLELVNMGTRLVISNLLEKTQPLFKIAAILSIGACLWYTFPLGRIHAFSIG